MGAVAAASPTPAASRGVGGLVVVGARRVALAWGSGVDAARDAGLTCGPPTIDDLVPGDPEPLRAVCRASPAAAVEVPGSGRPTRSIATHRAALDYKMHGLASATLWLDSPAEVVAARRAIAALPAARVVATTIPPPMPGDRDDLYRVGEVGFEIFQFGRKPGGFVALGLESASTASSPASVVETSRNRPRYTEAARKAGWQGAVLVRVALDARGAVTALEVIRHAPFGLDEAAAQAVRSWTFVPARRDGKPVPGDLVVQVPFRLP